jgi:hypothetical protein
VVSPKKVGATPKVPTKNSSKIIGVLDCDYACIVAMDEPLT